MSRSFDRSFKAEFDSIGNPVEETIYNHLFMTTHHIDCAALGIAETLRTCGIANCRASQKHPFGIRRRTNAESAQIGIHLVVSEKLRSVALDGTKPLPPQAAKWLREVAAKLLETADKVEAVKDEVDYEAVKKLANS